MKAIGCISKTEYDGKTLCSDCSFADDPAGKAPEGITHTHCWRVKP